MYTALIFMKINARRGGRKGEGGRGGRGKGGRLQAAQYKTDDESAPQNPGGPHDCESTLAFISSGWRGPFLPREKKCLINQREKQTPGKGRTHASDSLHIVRGFSTLLCVCS